MEEKIIKEAEERLRRSEERYRLLVEGVKDYAIFMLSPEGIVETWNKGARELKGYEDYEIIGKHFSVFYSQEDKDRKYPDYELREARKVGRFEDEGWRYRKDGSSFFANVIITALYDKNNELIAFAKITRNLTQRKEAEEALKKSEEKYRLLVEGVRDYAIFLLDTEGYIATWNEGAKRLKGYDESEIIGNHFSIFYTEEKKKLKYPEYELQQAIKYGKFEDEGLRVRKDGSTFYANVVITALFSSGKLIGFSKITRDLTERKQSEEKLEYLNSQLELRVKERTEELSRSVSELKAINADLDNFIYTASHDLKAPISNIEGLFISLKDLLSETNCFNEEVETMFGMIESSVARFRNTIRDLAAVNESQRVDRNDLAEIKLEEMVNDITESIDHLIKESQAQIVVTEDKSGVLKFSKIHFRSLLYNLISNAIKYRSPERVLQLKIASEFRDDQFKLTVTDNGLGIREDNLDKIFHLFSRLHMHVEGSGIGLYIVKKIVSNAGGNIEVRSRVNQGTEFRITLPV